jgi:hypothetical protein
VRRACDRPRRVGILLERNICLKTKLSYKQRSESSNLLKTKRRRRRSRAPPVPKRPYRRSPRAPPHAEVHRRRGAGPGHTGLGRGGLRSRAGGCLRPPAVGFGVSQIATARRNLATIPDVGSVVKMILHTPSSAWGRITIGSSTSESRLVAIVRVRLVAILVGVHVRVLPRRDAHR